MFKEKTLDVWILLDFLMKVDKLTYLKGLGEKNEEASQLILGLCSFKNEMCVCDSSLMRMLSNCKTCF